MENTLTIRERLNRILLEKFQGIDPNLSLTDQIDSLLLIDVLTEIENEFKIRIHDIEVDQESFKDLKSIEKLIEGKK